MRIAVLTHVPFEGPAGIADWAAERGHELFLVPLYDGAALPAPDEFEMLVVMGGPMNIYEHEEYPFLEPEKAFIRAAVDAGKRVLGICLGAQLMADALGGRVVRGKHREIGFFPVRLRKEAGALKLLDGIPSEFLAFHWHGDMFFVPDGGVLTASSEACASQAFVYGERAIGLQFHLETTQESMETLIRHCADELSVERYVQPAVDMCARVDRLPELNRVLVALMDNLAAS